MVGIIDDSNNVIFEDVVYKYTIKNEDKGMTYHATLESLCKNLNVTLHKGQVIIEQFGGIVHDETGIVYFHSKELLQELIENL